MSYPLTQEQLLNTTFGQISSVLPEGSATFLSRYLEHCLLEAGDVLWHEGDKSNCLAYILTGKLELLKATSFPGRPFVLGIFSSGSLVGEDSFLEEQSTHGTIQALEKTELLVLSRERFDTLSREQPELANQILKWLMNLLSARLHNTQGRLAAIF